MDRRGFLKRLLGGAAGVAATAVVKVEEQSAPKEIEAEEAYVRCARCDYALFLGTMAGDVDAITCPECGVTTLLGQIPLMHGKRLKVAKKRD